MANQEIVKAGARSMWRAGRQMQGQRGTDMGQDDKCHDIITRDRTHCNAGNVDREERAIAL